MSMTEIIMERDALKQQLVEYVTKHEVACSTINILQEKCDVRGKALAEQCKETRKLHEQLATKDAEIERLLCVLAEIAGSKSLTATPTQFYQHLQRIASDATMTQSTRR